jgi:oligopeptidase B
MKYSHFFILMFLIMSLAQSCAPSPESKHLTPPAAKKVAKTDTLHGDVRVDNYFWLREKENPDVTAYLNAENTYTNAVFGKRTQSGQDKLYNELLARVKETDMNVPTFKDGYHYYSRTEEGKQYSIYARKKETLTAPEQITLDLNKLAEGHAFLGLGEYSLTRDGSLLAYSLDTTGFRQYRLYFKNLNTGEILKEDIGYVSSFAWAADGKTFFYTVEDTTTKRSFRLFRRALGDAKGELLYEEPDVLFDIYLYGSRDEQYLFLRIGSKTTTELHYLDANKPREKFKVILPRETDHEYSVDHRYGNWFIRTNKNAKNFKLVTAPVASPTVWKELVAHRPSVALNDVDVFNEFCVCSVRDNGLIQLEVIDLKTNSTHRINFSEPTYSVFGASNPEFNTTKFRYSYQSLVTPSTVFEYDMKTRQQETLKEYEVMGGYDRTKYVSERIFATATDGAKVPMSIIYRKDTKLTAATPCHLYAYGSYGFALPVTFNASRLSMLDRGFVCVLAHIRGGADMGEAWHDEGKMMKKKNTFTDFIACAEHLITKNYTSKEKLVIEGGSAGGLLMGAVSNMRPDLFKAVHLAVPFVDVINTMLDETLPLTTGEFIEWGNPKKKEDYAYMKTYCPYTNIDAKDYPDMLITTSLNDSQVMYWEPAKYTAKMRAMRTDKNLLLLHINMDAGHGGASGRYDALHERALELAFFFDRLSIAY